MRFAWIFAALAALWVTPAQAVTLWKFRIQTVATGIMYAETESPVTMKLDFPIWLDVSRGFPLDLGHNSEPSGDPTGIGNYHGLLGGEFDFDGNSFSKGRNFSYIGGFRSGPCDTPCPAYYLTAPTFTADFLDASGGPAPVPEASTWVLMLVGFAGIGWGMRRGRVPLAVSPCRMTRAPVPG